MLREISEDIRINLKDRLREIRHTIRHYRHDGAGSGLPFSAGRRAPFPLPEIEGLIGHSISLFDDTLTAAEMLAPYDGSAVRPRPFDTYFGLDGNRHTGERAFRRDMYYLAKIMLARCKIAARPIQEAGFAAVHVTMLRQHKILLHPAEDKNSETQQIARLASLCAALTVELLRARPVRPLMAEDDAPLTREVENRFTILILASLALGVALASADPEPGTDLLDMAALAVEARLERIIPACHAADPISELTPIFAMLIFHLR